MRSALILTVALFALGCTAEATDSLPDTQAADLQRIAGTVLETVDASSYTYVRLETPDGEAWAAVPQAHLEIGSEIALANPQAMSNFESKALGRTFDTVYFGTLEGQRTAPAMARSGMGHAGAGEVDSPSIQVAKAGGTTGRTVAELYAAKDDLSGKTIALRGKVVKYNAGIMSRNWIHLQDGTGDAAAGTHDITVTSSDATALGEIVLVEGTLAVDRDFGAGYLYAVIVEDASVK